MNKFISDFVESRSWSKFEILFLYYGRIVKYRETYPGKKKKRHIKYKRAKRQEYGRVK